MRILGQRIERVEQRALVEVHSDHLGCGPPGKPQPPAGRSAPVARLVRDDLEQPWSERLAGTEATERPPCLHERILRGVLGVRGAARDHTCHAERNGLVRLDQRGERGAVTTPRTGDELRFLYRCLTAQVVRSIAR